MARQDQAAFCETDPLLAPLHLTRGRAEHTFECRVGRRDGNRPTTIRSHDQRWIVGTLFNPYAQSHIQWRPLPILPCSHLRSSLAPPPTRFQLVNDIYDIAA